MDDELPVLHWLFREKAATVFQDLIGTHANELQEFVSLTISNRVTAVATDPIVHRGDGPAVERPNGTREWFVEGIRHCASGPALISADGERRWFLTGNAGLDALTSSSTDPIKKHLL
jgi:hypothetical protein